MTARPAPNPEGFRWGPVRPGVPAVAVSLLAGLSGVACGGAGCGTGETTPTRSLESTATGSASTAPSPSAPATAASASALPDPSRLGCFRAVHASRAPARDVASLARACAAGLTPVLDQPWRVRTSSAERAIEVSAHGGCFRALAASDHAPFRLTLEVDGERLVARSHGTLAVVPDDGVLCVDGAERVRLATAEGDGDIAVQLVASPGAP